MHAGRYLTRTQLLNGRQFTIVEWMTIEELHSSALIINIIAATFIYYTGGVCLSSDRSGSSSREVLRAVGTCDRLCFPQ